MCTMKTIFGPDKLIGKILPQQSASSDGLFFVSQFVIGFQYGNRHFAFNTLTKHCVELSIALESFAPVSAGEISEKSELTELMRMRFLVPEAANECAVYEGVSALKRAFLRKKGYSTFTIMPTLACNARCVYCYEAGLQKSVMNEKTAAAAADFIARTRREGTFTRLIWFGGEPLLGEKQIDRICDELEKRAVDFDARIVTNGSLITDALAEKMASKWRVWSAQLSMDGARADYEKRKRYPSPGNYERVLENINTLTRHGVSVSVRCNVDMDNIADIPQALSDLSAAVLDKSMVSCAFVPLDQARAGEHGPEIWRSIIDAGDLIEASGLRYDRMGGLDTAFRVHHCMMDEAGGGVLIAPDGRLFPCLQCPEGSSYGNVFDGVTDAAALREFTSLGKLRAECKTCTFLPDCTAFTHCPIVDRDCEAVRRMRALPTLYELVRRADAGAPPAPDNEPPVE